MAIPVYKIKNWGKKGKVKKLIKALSDQDKLVRWTAARALGEIGDAKAAEPLVGALDDNYPIVKRNASEALVKIGSSAVDALIKGLADNNADISRESANVLKKVKDAKAVGPLIKALGHINPVVRGGATGALREIGTPAVDHLIDALETDDENIHKHAVEALAGIEDPKSLDVMIKALEDNNRDLLLACSQGAL